MSWVVAFDGGSTGTRAGLYDASEHLVRSVEGSPSNPVLLGVDRAAAVLVALGKQLLLGAPCDVTVAAGVSGARLSQLRDELARRLATDLAGRRALVTDDLRPTLYANAGEAASIIAVAGTGSSVVAQSGNGESILVGGRGSLFGDDGSGYAIAVAGLRGAAAAIDGMGPPTALVDLLPKAAGCDRFSALPLWAQSASKLDIAMLCPVIDAAANDGDAVALACVRLEADSLARQTIAAAARFGLTEAPVFMHGGVFRSSALFRAAFVSAVGGTMAGLRCLEPALRGHAAVARLGFAQSIPAGFPASIFENDGACKPSLPATENHRPSVPLDRLDVRDIVRAMNDADAEAPSAVAEQLEPIAEAVARIARAFEEGGRLIYIGAGTSGRLGVLDASECPPTFGTPESQVLALIAGGERALRHAVEGAEDDEQAARHDIDSIRPELNRADVMVGIAASGATPYVLAGLEFAKGKGASTILVACNPVRSDAADIVIAVETGPEVLAGSTRLKAGTATKMVLNTLSTGAMARTGRILDGYMVGVNTTNAKLWRRAMRIVTALTGLLEDDARKALEGADFRVDVVVVMQRRGVSREEAERLLEDARGNIHAALQIS